MDMHIYELDTITFVNNTVNRCVVRPALFCAMQLLIYDTQRVVGGKNRRFQLSPEEYIAGALELYLDVVYLFIIALTCFSR